MILTDENNGRVLRTLLRGDVYERLESYAKTLSTGMGKWDFGVAIERLLDGAEISEHLELLDTRLGQLETKFIDLTITSDNDKKPSNEHGLLGKNKKEEK